MDHFRFSPAMRVDAILIVVFLGKLPTNIELAVYEPKTERGHLLNTGDRPYNISRYQLSVVIKNLTFFIRKFISGNSTIFCNPFKEGADRKKREPTLIFIFIFINTVFKYAVDFTTY